MKDTYASLYSKAQETSSRSLMKDRQKNREFSNARTKKTISRVQETRKQGLKCKNHSFNAKQLIKHRHFCA